MSKEEGTRTKGGGGQRRSARIWALEEEKRKMRSSFQEHQKHTNNIIIHKTMRKKRQSRKRKCLQLISHYPSHHVASITTTANFSSLQQMPKKHTLDFVLDILPRRDTQEIFAQPVDPEEVVGYYNIIKEPMDFGTVRAKLQEGMYTSLEQFERDVFLISSNAMKFNSSTTVYYTEARAISELAQRVFHALRTEPEKFELHYSWTRRCPDRTHQGEAGSSQSHRKQAKFDGVSLNGPTIKRSTQTYLASSCLHTYTDKSDMKVSSGEEISVIRNLKPKLTEALTPNVGFQISPRDGRSLNASETERRLTYMHQTSFLNEKESIVSAVYNAPKPLTLVPNASFRYVESLMQFGKDLGPTANMVANRKLARCPIEAPNSLSWSPTSFRKTTHCMVAAPSTLQRPTHLNDVNNGQMLHSFISNAA